MKARKDYGLYSKKIYGFPSGTTVKSSKVWVPPPVGCMKLNRDASLSDEGWVGVGLLLETTMAQSFLQLLAGFVVNDQWKYLRARLSVLP